MHSIDFIFGVATGAATASAVTCLALRRIVNAIVAIMPDDEPDDGPAADGDAAEILRALLTRLGPLPDGHGEGPCSHAIYLTDAEVDAARRAAGVEVQS